MTKAKKQFEDNLRSVLVLDAIYNFLVNQVTALDISELLRAEFFLIVSTLDQYIHEVVRDGLLKTFDTSNESKGLNSVSIPLQQVKTLLGINDELERKQFLNAAIKKSMSKDTYESPTSIENALGFLGIDKIWTRVCKDTERKPKDTRDQLALIVHRRNKIAHEADIDFATGEKIPIDKETIKDCLFFVQWFVSSVDLIVENMDAEL